MNESGGPGIIGTKQPKSPKINRTIQMAIMRGVMVQKYKFTMLKIRRHEFISFNFIKLVDN